MKGNSSRLRMSPWRLRALTERITEGARRRTTNVYAVQSALCIWNVMAMWLRESGCRRLAGGDHFWPFINKKKHVRWQSKGGRQNISSCLSLEMNESVEDKYSASVDWERSLKAFPRCLLISFPNVKHRMAEKTFHPSFSVRFAWRTARFYLTPPRSKLKSWGNETLSDWTPLNLLLRWTTRRDGTNERTKEMLLLRRGIFGVATVSVRKWQHWTRITIIMNVCPCAVAETINASNGGAEKLN